jgi:hypothetical protein
MTDDEKDRLFNRLLAEYRDLFADMDDLNRTLWLAVNEENELMSFIVGADETPDDAIEPYKVKLLAIAAALESLTCAATEKRSIEELREMAARVTTAWPVESVVPEGEEYISELNRMTPDEFSQHIDDLYERTISELRSENII